MYEKYTRQSLPSREYRELLGSCLCVFNSNNGFIIENILKHENGSGYTWHNLIDLESGRLKEPVRQTLSESHPQILDLFEEIISMRNRIIHSFRITNQQGEQILSTKNPKNQQQFHITEEFMMDFIRLNEQLSGMLHEYRGY